MKTSRRTYFEAIWSNEASLLFVVVEVERPLGRNRGKAGADRVFSESDAGGDDRLVGSRRTADGRVDVDLDVEVVSVELGKMKSWLNVAT